MSGERPVAPPPGDDDLRAMLEGRAARVTSADMREVLAAARAEIAGRGAAGSGAVERDGRTFGVRPVRVEPRATRGGRGSRMPWRVAVLAIAAVVAIAVLGSRLDLGPKRLDTGASPTSSLEVVRSGSLERAPVEMLTPAELDAGVLGGTLVGRTVIVFGHLDRRLGLCRSVDPPPTGCWWLVFPGLENRHIDPGSAGYREVGLALARHGGDEPVALRVLGSEVNLLGWVVDGANRPLEPTGFEAGTTPLDTLELALIGGWLAPAHGDANCVQRVGGGCGPHPRLTDTAPFIEGTWTAGVPGIDVAVPESFGLDEDKEFMVGRFLVGAGAVQLGGNPAPYAVIATLDAAVQRADQQVTPIDPSLAPTSPPPAAGHMTADDFERAVRLGELDGRVVVVEGRMRLVIGRCRAPAEDCTWFQLEGLPGTWIGKGDLSVDEAGTAIRRHPNNGPIALRVSDGAAHLVGWISAGASTPVDVAALRAGDLPLDPGDVAIVGGWLLGAPAAPSCTATPETCAMWPVLSPTEPIPGVILYGDSGMAVMVAERLGLPAAPATIEGPFVVAAWRAPSAGEPGLEVVDRFSDGTLVDVPTARSATPAPAPTPTPAASAPMSPPAGVLTADELMTALANGSLDGRIVTVTAELKTVAWDCPVDAPQPCERFYVDGLPGIAVTYSGPALVSSTGMDGGNPVTRLTGRMVVVPRNGHLELLGRVDADLLAPVTVGAEPLVPGFPYPDPLQLRPLRGWLVRTPSPSGCPPASPMPGIDIVCSVGGDELSNQPPEGERLPAAALRMEVVVTNGPGLEGFGTFLGGPFLVRGVFQADECPSGTTSCATTGQTRTEVVARYDPADVVEVDLP